MFLLIKREEFAVLDVRKHVGKGRSLDGYSCSFAKRLLSPLRYTRANTGALRLSPDHFKRLRS
jgi:hypothetical protein